MTVSPINFSREPKDTRIVEELVKQYIDVYTALL
jgi:hypothetical protein